MLPDFDWFGREMDTLGVSPLDPVVVYDQIGQFSSARAFWTLRTLGSQSVSVLDGGLPKWMKEKYLIKSGPLTVDEIPKANPMGTWTRLTKPRFDRVVDEKQVMSHIALTKHENKQLVDARASGRFLGLEPEPRPNLKRGSIPNSINVPFKECLNDDGTFKSKPELKEMFSKRGVDLSGDTQVYTSCGSGTTAAILSFALEQLLEVDAPLYDGSFAEYAREHEDRPTVVIKKI